MDLIGVRFDGSGRRRGQSVAAEALRAAGLVETLGPRARPGPDVEPPPPSEARGPRGFLNEAALLAMVDAVRERVGASLRRAGTPLVYGADCAVLLGAVPALAEARGGAGLLFLDGHEDATPMALSSSGEAANMEVGMLLDSTLRPEAVAMLGQRDEGYRAEIGAPSIAGTVSLQGVAEVRADPEGVTRRAAERIARAAPAWWLHIDLDVLDGSEFPACGSATDPVMGPGLTWDELTSIAATALRSPGCAGWNVGVYNTDLDPERAAAHRIVHFIAAAAP